MDHSILKTLTHVEGRAMTDVPANHVSLRMDNVQLVIAVKRGQRPSIVHWGRALAHSAPEEFEVLSTRQWAFGGPTEDVAPSLSNELGAGLGGPSGLLAHRDGGDWASFLRVEQVEMVTAQHVRIHCRDKNVGLGVTYDVALGPDHAALSITISVKNEGDAALFIAWAPVMAMPLDERLSRVWGVTGRWAHEFEVQEIGAHRGTYLRENKAGRTSHDNFPGLIALAPFTHETAGPCAGFHLGWSGNNRVRIDRHTDGRSFVQMGELFFPGEMKLDAGEVYRSPTLYAVWSDTGLNTLSQSFHRVLRQDILDGRSRAKPRLVHYNTWEAVYFDHGEDKSMALADRAAAVGAERFVLDDGWFGGRRSDRAGLGDWTVSSAVYPNGLHPLVDHVRSLGMEFGIWFEPEMVNPDSDLYRQHPDWVLNARGVEQVPFREQYTLDLTRPEVSAYLFDAIDAIVKDYRVDYIKWDMNRDSTHPGGMDQRPVIHRQTHAVYSLMDRLRRAHPELEIESCASGGARADFGILRYTDRVWTSDNNDALDRQRIQRGASYFFPPDVLGSHVGPKRCHITGRMFDMEFRAATAMLGHMGMELDLSEETDADLDVLRRAIALYKAHRALIHSGDLYRLEASDYLNMVGVVAKDQSAALFSCAKVEGHSTTLPGRIRFAGLAPDKHYLTRLIWPTHPPSVTAPSIVEAADLCGDGTVFRGEALVHFGIQLPLMHPNSCLLYHLESVEG